MRDPELVVRAQRAATGLERAWDRWRTANGLGTEPLPPVSSYVGYSLEEPWGQPRVVFGIAADEAEQLATLLERCDRIGPVYSAMTSLPGTRTERGSDASSADPDRGLGGGRIRVPTQVQAGPAQRKPAAEPGQSAAGLPGPAEPPQRVTTEAAPAAEAQAREPSPDHPVPALGDDQAGQPAGTGQPATGWTRTGRLPGGHALQRHKRAGGAAKGASAKQEGKHRSSRSDIAQLSGWAAAELPGQASHRRAPRPAG